MAFRPPLVDVAIAGGLFVLGLILAMGNARIFEGLFDDYDPPSDVAVVVSIAVSMVPIAFRRVFPLGALLFISLAMVGRVAYGVVEISSNSIAMFVALVSAGVYGRAAYRDWARGFFTLCLAVMLFAYFVSGSGNGGPSFSPRFSVVHALAEVGINVVFLATAWVLGDWERRRRQQSTELVEANRELQHALDRLDAQSANEERLAIAREVHDIVGHTVSLMGVQAAAARRQLAVDRDAAESMLRTMEEQSREGVEELRGLISVLRGPAEDEETDQPHAFVSANRAAAMPTAGEVDDLVDQVRAAGVEVTCSIVGEPPAAAGVGLSLYRVLQEALSNAMRHGAGAIEVVIDHEAGQSVLFVSNPIAGVVGSPGSGLSGMRERVKLHGGTMTAGRVGRDRFEVKATFPIPVTVSERVKPGEVGAKGTVAR